MIKAILKKVIRSCGYELVRAHRVPARVTIEEAMRHLVSLNFSPSIVIDVGAASGTEELLRVFPKSRYLWIEPLQEFEESLKRLGRKYQGDYVIAACGRQRGQVPFHVHASLTGSSILHESEGSGADGYVRLVPMYRLDELSQKYSLQGDMLLKIDVQGAELEVMEGAGHLLPLFDVVILEVSLFRFMSTNPDIYDVIVYMKQKGFAAFDVVGGKTRLLDGALAQLDIVFVKENGRFRESHHWATPKQRELYVAENSGR